MATFHIRNFGCRASQADGAALKQQLLEAGLQETASADTSAVAVLNTCTVTAAADAEVRRIVRRIHRRNPQCRILVTGCYAQRAPQEIAKLEGVAWVVGNSHKHLIQTILALGNDRESAHRLGGPSAQQSGNEFAAPSFHPQMDATLVQIQTTSGEGQMKSDEPSLHLPDRRLTQSPDSSEGSMARRPDGPMAAPAILVGVITDEFHFAPTFPDDRTRPTLKIQDGCDARCAFCIIPFVRGRSRSLPPEGVIDEVRKLTDAGYQEVVLSGINLGGYGRDLDRSINFLGIVERILRETSIARLRISSIEPMDVTPALIRLVAEEPRMAQHFHVPLQSGCDRILRLMNRRYWTRQYAERMLSIHQQIPNAAMGADVMVGFPGETSADHAASLRFIAAIPFTYLHIFPFSARPDTSAATATGQVNGRVMRERAEEIRQLITVKRQAFLSMQVGRSLAAVTLDESEDGARIALTTNYLKVVLPNSDLPPNRLADVPIGRVAGGKLFGYLETAGRRC